MKSKKTPTAKKKYSQYYTQEKLGEVLIGSIPSSHAKYIESAIDLSAGEGALLLACKARFNDISLHAFDIDKKNTELLNLLGIQAFTVDACSPDIEKLYGVNESSYSLSLGNPPFQNIEVNSHINSLYARYGLPLKGNYIRAENYFLLYSLYLLKENGVAAFIVPQGIIAGERSKIFRKVLCEHFNIIEVKEVPTKIFAGTEAKTFIIIISKQKSDNSIAISHYNQADRVEYINNEDFIERGDFKYYLNSASNKGMREMNFSIYRGGISGKEAKLDPQNIIHTTSLNERVTYFNAQHDRTSIDSLTTARVGDIITPRVGSRAIGKIGIIQSGSYKISDCLFIIRAFSEKDRAKIISFLDSKEGCRFILAISRGVGAKYITTKDMQLLAEYI